MTADTRRVFGEHEGETVEEITITSRAGVEIAILSFGALIRDWRVPVNGEMRSVVLGFETIEPYMSQNPYFGAICGRVGNRIGGAQFNLEGERYALDANEGRNQLHGGSRGFALRNWTPTEVQPDRVTLTLESPEGEMGYPGTLAVSVTYRIVDYRLDIEIEAQTDAPTPVNIVQHNYFNLGGQGDVLDHALLVEGSAVTELDDEQIPTGAVVPVKDSVLDFTTARPMRDAKGQPVKLDINYALATRRDLSKPVARLLSPQEDLALSVRTDQPGLQVYNGWKIAPETIGNQGRSYGPFSGLCLEDQIFPDAVNHPHFPDSIVTPDRPYRHWCAIEIEPVAKQSRH